MKFSWKAFLLAPLPMPLVFSLVLVGSTESRSPVLGVLVLFAIGSFLAYCLTAALFLPCLYLASKCIALNFSRTSILGAALPSRSDNQYTLGGIEEAASAP